MFEKNKLIVIKNTFYLFLFVFSFFLPFSVKALTVSTFSDLQHAITNGVSEIEIDHDMSFDGVISINGNVSIVGNNYSLVRKEGYTGSLFSINSGAVLTISDFTIDGGAANWVMDYDNRFYTQAENKGYVRVPTITSSNDTVASVALITNTGELITNNVTFQNGASSAVGCAISGAGNSTIDNSNFIHLGSSKNGGAMYISGGTTKITNSKFRENVAGYSVTTSINGGAIYSTDSAVLDIENTTIEDCLAEGNGGGIFSNKAHLKVNNSVFRHNMAGNDGSAIDLENKTTTIYSVEISDSVFEKNHGLATTGQSMGTIWIGSKWNNTEDTAIIMKNLVFRENIARTGGGISDNSADTYIHLDNVEVYNNEVGSGSFLYGQGCNYYITGLYVHDNEVSNGAGIYLYGANVILEKSKINHNTGVGAGTGIYIGGGTMTIKDSEITNNVAGSRGGGIFVRGTYEDYMPNLVLENTIIKDNTAKSGGGILINDNENVFSSIVIDDTSKVYDNTATDSGDDFVYVRENNSENTSSNSITLDNISIAGITGIDGWYYDNEGDRFLDTDNPTTFQNYVHYNGSGIYLKAAGLNSADYDLNGGTNDDIKPVVIRYGATYTVSLEQPIKDGFTFTGWNTQPDGSGIWLKAGDSYDGSDGYVLYAQYRMANPYTGNEFFRLVFLILLFTICISISFIYKKEFN